ncbi:protein-tyrosine sulfotransferase 2 isoform X2 [Amia ocellicauda]
MRLSLRRIVVVTGGMVATLLFLLVCQRSLSCRDDESEDRDDGVAVLVRDRRNVEFSYNRQAALVFVGGVPRSGTTLMRAMLDAHAHVRCGQETRVIPRLLALRQGWGGRKERVRLQQAGVTERVLDDAVAAFLLQVMARHGEPAPTLCNKDPFTLKSALYLSHLFPQSKFLLMIRDGRAAVHSMISRKVTIAGFDLGSYRDCLGKWSRAVEVMVTQCERVGEARCLAVRYEALVLRPRDTLSTVLRFLQLPWDEAVLHHEDAIGQPGGVALSRIERSTDQVMQPVNLGALSRWVGQIPLDVLAELETIAPMLNRLGYDPHANPPYYGEAEPIVLNNTERVLRGDFKTPATLKQEPLASLNVSDSES